MTQQLDATFAPQQHTADPATHGWPTSTVPNPGYPPGNPPASHPSMPTYGVPGPAAPGAGPGRSGGGVGIGRLLAIVSAVTVVFIVLGGVLMWLLLDPGHPTTGARPIPATSQPAASPVAPAAPSGDSPAVAATARQQLTAAAVRYRDAAQRFNDQATVAARAHDKEGMRTAVTDFRQATSDYDAEVRAITFPEAQQTVVNTQLLEATGRLVTDLDQFADLDPATVDATGDRANADLTTSMDLSQQVMVGLGG